MEYPASKDTKERLIRMRISKPTTRQHDGPITHLKTVLKCSENQRIQYFFQVIYTTQSIKNFPFQPKHAFSQSKLALFYQSRTSHGSCPADRTAAPSCSAPTVCSTSRCRLCSSPFCNKRLEIFFVVTEQLAGWEPPHYITKTLSSIFNLIISNKTMQVIELIIYGMLSCNCLQNLRHLHRDPTATSSSSPLTRHLHFIQHKTEWASMHRNISMTSDANIPALLQWKMRTQSHSTRRNVHC